MNKLNVFVCLVAFGLVTLGTSSSASAQNAKPFGDWAFTFLDLGLATPPVTLNVDNVELQGSKISNQAAPGGNTIRGRLKGKRTVEAVISLDSGAEYIIVGEYDDIGLGTMVGVFEYRQFFQPTGIYGIFFGSRVLQ